jgi:peptide/nickel transport system permease protein
LILLFGVDLKWLPISGSGSWQHFIMPGLTLSAFSIARNMRLTRSSMLDYMQKDFVRTARSKGLPEGRVIYGHVLRYSLLPIVTRHRPGGGLPVGRSVIVETILFGRVLAARSSRRSAPRLYVVQAGVIMLALTCAGVNLDRPDLHVDRSADSLWQHRASTRAGSRGP